MSAWRWTRPKVWVLTAAGVAACFVPGAWRAYQLAVRADQLETEIAALAAANRDLLVEMDRLQRDPLYIERVARRKLGRVREGEILVKTVPPGREPPPDPSPRR